MVSSEGMFPVLFSFQLDDVICPSMIRVISLPPLLGSSRYHSLVCRIGQNYRIKVILDQDYVNMLQKTEIII